MMKRGWSQLFLKEVSEVINKRSHLLGLINKLFNVWVRSEPVTRDTNAGQALLIIEPSHERPFTSKIDFFFLVKRRVLHVIDKFSLLNRP